MRAQTLEPHAEEARSAVSKYEVAPTPNKPDTLYPLASMLDSAG
jgi:hypothetical protein